MINDNDDADDADDNNDDNDNDDNIDDDNILQKSQTSWHLCNSINKCTGK
jgi:hypothetical protein